MKKIFVCAVLALFTSFAFAEQMIRGDSQLGFKLGATQVGQLDTAKWASTVPYVQKRTVTSKTTAGAVTYTAAEILGGFILRDPNGAARADLFPTAAAIITALYTTPNDTTAGVANVVVGHSFFVDIRNEADAAETITMTTNTGLTLSGVMTIPIGSTQRFLVVVTGATTVSIYGTIGTNGASTQLSADGSVAGATGQAQDFGTNGIVADVIQAKSAGSNPTIKDSSGNELVIFTRTASAVNEITITNNSTGVGPIIAASGETNVPLTVRGKGTGKLALGQSTATGVQLVADQPLLDSNGNEYFKFSATSSAINEITVTNAAIATSPSLTATGDDTNIGLKIGGKGTGVPQFQLKPTFKGAAVTLTSANNTATIAQLKASVIVKTTANGNLTLPTAALIVAGLPGCAIGDSFQFIVSNRSGGVETVVIGANGTSVTGNTLTIADGSTKTFLVELTNVTGASETYNLYSLGTYVH